MNGAPQFNLTNPLSVKRILLKYLFSIISHYNISNDINKNLTFFTTKPKITHAVEP
jgi:hypothetical protein